ncbi:MAG: Ppx/GppA family phosphatase, partial [Peptococcaceae bacterium]|nr:Ppx/GppA family phosphatase [Peptococcaceae bacterium]
MRKAVIDMGTNSTRLAIGEQGNGTVQIVYTQVAETRLGEGMGTERIIQPEPLKRNIETVKHFMETARLMNAYDFRITATSAVRDAANQVEVLQEVSKAAGVFMEV